MQATCIGSVVVETSNILTASKVALKAARKAAVRGSIKIGGRYYRWSTLQQFEQHNGFTKQE